MSNNHFVFQQFRVEQDRCAMKVGTDGVLLGAWANVPQTDRPTVLDIGTGTGIVALMIAQRFHLAAVTAIDSDCDAALQAQANAAASPFANRICVEHKSLQDFVTENLVFDALVCNPPYFYDSLVSPDRQRTTARHALTLTVRDIAQSAVRLLNKGGELSVILPYDQRGRMEAEAVYAGLFLKRLCVVKTAVAKPPSRVLMSFTNQQSSDLEQTTLTIGDSDYLRLTQDFYLK